LCLGAFFMLWSLTFGQKSCSVDRLFGQIWPVGYTHGLSVVDSVPDLCGLFVVFVPLFALHRISSCYGCGYVDSEEYPQWSWSFVWPWLFFSGYAALFLGPKGFPFQASCFFRSSVIYRPRILSGACLFRVSLFGPNVIPAIGHQIPAPTWLNTIVRDVPVSPANLDNATTFA